MFLLNGISRTFLQKLAVYKVQMGIPDSEFGLLQSDYNALSWLNNAIEQVKNEGKEFTAYREAIASGNNGLPVGGYPILNPLPAAPNPVQPGAMGRLRAVVRRIKASPGYTEPIGKDMGIVRVRPVLPLNPKPIGRIAAQTNSRVVVKFVKAGFDGVRIESKRGVETTWNFLSNALRSPWTDERAPAVPGMPEVRQYRLIYLKGNDTLGEPSDTMIVSTMPEFLRMVTLDEALATAIYKGDWRNAPGLTERDHAMLAYVEMLTLHPARVQRDDLERMRQHGFDDTAILQVNLIASWFNYINRVADGLGVGRE